MNPSNPAGGCPLAKIDATGKKVISFLKEKVREMYGDERPYRIFHAKTIGLVEAEFIVEDNLSSHLRVGLFASPGRYKAWVRFTNSSATISPDKEKAVRGMAIKIMDVPGTPCPDHTGDPGTQDIVLSNSRSFSPGSGRYALSAVHILLGNLIQKAAGAIRIFSRYFRGSLLFLKYPIVTPNILEEIYYSGTPYSFGEGRRIKWRATPGKTITSVLPEQPNYDFLRKRLAIDLAKNAKDAVEFGLFVQFQQSERTEPIDDSSVVWKTPFHRVATIRIPRQRFTTPERWTLEAGMCFNPGNALVEHAPLGTINRIRVEAYREMAKDRLSHPAKIGRYPYL